MTRSNHVELLDALYPALARRYRDEAGNLDMIARAAQALCEAGETDGAVSMLEDAVARLEPSSLVFFEASNTQLAAGNLAAAHKHLRSAIALDPTRLYLQRCLTHFLRVSLDCPAEAAAVIADVARTTQEESDYNQLARCLANAPTAGALLAAIDAALDGTAEPVKALHAAGHTLLMFGRYEEALGLGEFAIRRDRTDSVAWSFTGWAHWLQGRPCEACEHFSRAVRANHTDSWAAWSLSIALHALGQYPESREVLRQPAISAMLASPTNWVNISRRWEINWNTKGWAGEPLAGTSVQLNLLSGWGDVIYGVRLAGILSAQGARVRVVAKQPIVTLIEDVPGVDGVFTPFDDIPDCDYYVNPVAVRMIFGWDGVRGAESIPYLFVDEPALAKWRIRVASDAELAVGVSWECSEVSQVMSRPLCSRRSVPLVSLAPLANEPGIRLWNLLKSPLELRSGGALAPVSMGDVMNECGDFRDFGALVAAMDAIVTVDTVVAHVGGALGKPVFLLVPFAPEWKWEVGRSDCDWYPTLRIFRQSNPRDWRSAIEGVRQALAQLAAERRTRGCAALALTECRDTATVR